MGVWDPLGLSTSGNASDYKRRREVELKRGRVCMFATMGYIALEYTHLSGNQSPSYGTKFSEVPDGLAAISKCRRSAGARSLCSLAALSSSCTT